MLGAALVRLGTQVSLAQTARPSPPDAGACFAQAAGGELMVAGRKVVGSAQYRQGTALLQHGSILLEDAQGIVLGLTRARSAEEVLAEPGETLGAPLGQPLSYPELVDAIVRAAALLWPAAWQRIATADHVLEAASHHYPHYQSAAWTWVR
jgi:lipoate-protein ligase A